MLGERPAIRAVLLGLSVCAIGLRVWQALERAVIPYQIDYAEGTVLASALRLLHGESLYPPPGSFPYILSPYGPVAYLLTAASMKVLGVSLLGPRLLVLMSAMLIAALIVGLTKALEGSRTVGVVFAAAFFCSPLLAIWLPLLRVDLPGVLLSLAGLYVFARFQKPGLASLMFVAAGFTKQTCIAGLLACGTNLAMERRWRDLGVLAAWTCGLGMAVAAVLGANGFFHLVATHRDPFDIGRYLDNVTIALSGAIVLVLGAAYGLVGHWRLRSGARLGLLYLAACTLLTFTAGKAGAETNHFIEWTAALALVGALSTSCAVSQQDRHATLVVGSVLAVTLVTIAGVWWRPRHDIDVDACRAAYNFIDQFPGDRILSEDVSAVVEAGKPVIVSDPFAYQQVRDVSWEQGGLEQLVARGFFDLIVAGRESFTPGHLPVRWSPALSAEVAQEYRPVRWFNCSPALGVVYVKANSAR